MLVLREVGRPSAGDVRCVVLVASEGFDAIHPPLPKTISNGTNERNR